MRLIDADVLIAKIDAWDESARNGTNPTIGVRSASES